jgi:hypothetical protein
MTCVEKLIRILPSVGFRVNKYNYGLIRLLQVFNCDFQRGILFFPLKSVHDRIL